MMLEVLVKPCHTRHPLTAPIGPPQDIRRSRMSARILSTIHGPYSGTTCGHRTLASMRPIILPHLATLGLRRYVTAGSRGCRSPPSGHSPSALAGLSRAGIQEQLVASAAPALAAPLAGKGEQVVQASRFLVEGEVADAAGVPVVLDEPQDRGLVGRCLLYTSDAAEE